MTEKKCSFKEVPIKILEKNSEPKTHDIALEEKTLETSSVTPEATMAAQIYMDISSNKHIFAGVLISNLFLNSTKT